MSEEEYEGQEEPYTAEEVERVIQDNKDLRNRHDEMAGMAASSSNFAPDEYEGNLIQAQLDTDKILERFEHYLKGDQITFGEQGAYYSAPTKNVLARKMHDPKTKVYYFIHEFKKATKGTEIGEALVKIKNEDGSEIDVLEEDGARILTDIKKLELKEKGYQYISVLDEEMKPLNEYGVAEFMRILSMYVTKETFLSNYEEDRINEILGDLGDALNNLLYSTYDKMGMDSKFKESKYEILVLSLLHVVENCYRRALGGEEQRSLRTRAIVTQNQSGMPIPIGAGQRRKPMNPFKPSTW